MKKQTNQTRAVRLGKYRKYLDKEAEKFKLTREDLSNLYDLFYMADNPPELNIDFKETLKLNKMDKWFYNFHRRIEDVVIPELKKKKEKKW
jgi:hypothetical protein